MFRGDPECRVGSQDPEEEGRNEVLKVAFAESCFTLVISWLTALHARTRVVRSARVRFFSAPAVSPTQVFGLFVSGLPCCREEGLVWASQLRERKLSQMNQSHCRGSMQSIGSELVFF